MSNLPTSWARCSLGDLIENIEAGLNVKCEERPPEKGERGLVKISAVTWGRFDESQSKTLPSDAMPGISKKINQGDLLFSRANTLELVGASVIVHDIKKELYLSDKVLRLVISDGMKSWVNYALKTQAMRKAIGEASSGNQLSMRNISQDKLKALELPIAPLAEQRRITDKLDTTLARVDALNDRLARITPLLKRFRQSVLAAATSGRLTEEWRARRDELELSAWHRTNLRSCIKSMKGGASPKVEDYSSSGTLALNKGDIKPYGYLNSKKNKKFLPKSFVESNSTKIINPGTLVVTLRDLSSKADFLGLISEYISSENAMITQGMYALELNSCVIKKYLIYFSNSNNYREIMKREKVGATQVHLRNDQFLDVPIALPSLEEQTEIVRRVETLFAFADRLEARLQYAQTAAERLTPALLAKAFRGELVPQDPNDEPATELLRRLRAARAADTASKPKRGRAAKASTVSE